LQQLLSQQWSIVKNLSDVAEIVDLTRAAQADDVTELLATAYRDEDALAHLTAILQGRGDVIV
jgi:hypothetical protein